MLDLGGLLISLLITAAIVGAFVFGRFLGAEQERTRAARTRRNIEKARKAT
jgi:uncharacterized integral membrane protein